jgi:hypothetical protein
MSFVAFYPAGVSNMFPPHPFKTYWQRPDQSSIASAQWSLADGSFVDCSSLLTQLLQQGAGPRQSLPSNSVVTETAPHRWPVHLLATCFPCVFTPPSMQPANATNLAEMDPRERRRLQRLQRATINENKTKQTQLLITLANQMIFSFPWNYV